MYARPRPHTLQRFFCLTPNFGLILILAIFAAVATLSSLPQPRVKGIPSSRSKNWARSSFPAVVTMVIFIPLGRSTLL